MQEREKKESLRPSNGIVVIGTSQSGNRREGTFMNLPEAVSFCIEERDENYSITLPTEVGVKGRLLGIRGEEMLELTLGNKTGVVPRAYSLWNGERRAGLTVSTNYDYERWLDICMKIFEYDDPVFDRGIFWMGLNDTEKTNLKFVLLHNQQAEQAELLERIKQGERKSVNILHNALNGIYPEE